MSEPSRNQGSTVLFVAVGIVALLLASLVVGVAALVLARPTAARTAPPPFLPPPPVPTKLGVAASALAEGPSDAELDSGAPSSARDASAMAKPLALAGSAAVSGSLPPDVIRRVVQRHLARIRFCYEQGLAKNPSLAGKVKIRFVIATDGTVATATESDSTLGDSTVTACITRTFQTMVFPAPSGGIVTVTYPLVFASAGP